MLKVIKHFILACFIFLAPLAAQAKTQTYVMYGVGGPLFSGPMANIAKKTNGKIYFWWQWPQILNEVNKTPRTTKVAVVGHSMGANALTYIQAKSKRKIDYCGSYDPTVWAPVEKITKCKKTDNLYSINYLNPFGHAKLSGKNVKNRATKELHTVLPGDAIENARTIQNIRAL